LDAIDERKALIKGRKIAIPEGVDIGEWFFTDGQGGLFVERKTKAETIVDLVEDHLAQRRLAVDARQLSQASYASDRYRLAAFQTYCEKKRRTGVSNFIAPEHLDSYRSHLLGRFGRGQVLAVPAKHALRTVKAMLLWAYAQEKIDVLPRVLDKYASVRQSEEM